MTLIENGSRLDAVKASLEAQPNVVVRDVTETSTFDDKRGKTHRRTTFSAVPAQGSFDQRGLVRWADTLLTDVEPVLREVVDENTNPEGRNNWVELQSFDVLSPTDFRLIVVRLFPNENAFLGEIK